MWLFMIVGISCVALSFLLSRSMDALQFGFEQSRLSGINPKRTQWLIILLCAAMTGWITAYCGPVGFIGLCVPHIARPLAKSVSHFKLMLLSVSIGICISLFCLLVTRMNLFNGSLPLNAVTSFLGAPFVIYILIKYRNQSAF
jgi:iron complex transport system permease protein